MRALCWVVEMEMKRKKGGELTDATRAQGGGCAIQLRTARPLSSLNSRRTLDLTMLNINHIRSMATSRGLLLPSWAPKAFEQFWGQAAVTTTVSGVPDRKSVV